MSPPCWPSSAPRTRTPRILCRQSRETHCHTNRRHAATRTVRSFVCVGVSFRASNPGQCRLRPTVTGRRQRSCVALSYRRVQPDHSCGRDTRALRPDARDRRSARPDQCSVAPGRRVRVCTVDPATAASTVAHRVADDDAATQHTGPVSTACSPEWTPVVSHRGTHSAWRHGARQSRPLDV